MASRLVPVARGRLDAVVQAPPSKSATHRALVVAALASGTSVVHDPLDAEDTRRTLDGVAALGVPIRVGPGRWEVRGLGGRVPGGGDLRLGGSGTSLRFLLALAALGERPSRLDGEARLRERPLEPLVRVLEDLGARFEPEGEGATLPLVAGGKAPRGGEVRLPGGISSQFASALLLVGARLPGGIGIRLEGGTVSLPYVDVTVEWLARFGVAVQPVGEAGWRVPPCDYAGREVSVEGDASAASYFLAAAALLGGRVRVERLDARSRHPDARFGRILESLGCRVRSGESWVEVEGSGRVPSFDLDLSPAPDLVPTLAALALFSDGPCVIRGVPHLRHKESDRLEGLAAALRALGREARATDEALWIGPPPERPLRGARVATLSDHRIAMAIGVAGLRLGNVELDDATCVSKSNPGFWEQLGALGAETRPR